MKLPEDIILKIDELFPADEDNSNAKKLIGQIYTSTLNVGQDQLTRSILYISNGNISEIKRIIDSNFYGDPRDVIMDAEHRAGNPGHYFLNAFS